MKWGASRMANIGFVNSKKETDVQQTWNDPLARRRAFYWALLALALVVLMMWPHTAHASESGGRTPV